MMLGSTEVEQNFFWLKFGRKTNFSTHYNLPVISKAGDITVTSSGLLTEEQTTSLVYPTIYNPTSPHRY